MAISVLVEVLLPSGTAGATLGPAEDKGDKPGSMKDWLRNKLKALARLLGKLGSKVQEELPGIIGVIISWILNRVKEVVSWVLETYGALVSEGCFICTWSRESNFVFMMEMTFSLPSTTRLLQSQPCSKQWMLTSCHAVHCWGCKSHSVLVFKVEASSPLFLQLYSANLLSASTFFGSFIVTCCNWVCFAILVVTSFTTTACKHPNAIIQAIHYPNG